MEPEKKNRGKFSSQKEPEKIGLLKRFLNWIARGTGESPRGRRSCPT